MIEQLSLFPSPAISDPRPPETITWNLWHGCTRVSTGCRHCYMFRRDEAVGKDPTKVQKTQAFNLPIRILRAGSYKGLYKIKCRQVLTSLPASHLISFIKMLMNGGAKHGI